MEGGRKQISLLLFETLGTLFGGLWSYFMSHEQYVTIDLNKDQF